MRLTPIHSHNVPPYGRAGLYKQLAELKALLSEYREDASARVTLMEPIVNCLNLTGISRIWGIWYSYLLLVVVAVVVTEAGVVMFLWPFHSHGLFMTMVFS